MSKAIKHYVFHRGNEWSSELEGSTKTIARECLRRGDAVTYIEGLSAPWRWIGKWLRRTGRSHTKRLHVVTRMTLLPLIGISPSPVSARAAYAASVPPLSWLHHTNRRPDIIWSSEPGGSELKRMYPESTFVFQVIDRYTAYRGPQISRLEQHDYARADHVVTVGHALRSYLQEAYGVPPEKITVCPPAVNLTPYERQQPEPSDLVHMPHPRYTWVGEPSKCDIDLIRHCAQELQGQGCIIIIGRPSRHLRRQLARCANIHMLGPKKPAEVPAYLQHTDVGLMVYDRTHAAFRYGQSPIKLYEYAAAGLPIVSTPHEEFAWVDPPVVTISDEQELSKALQYIKQHYNELSHASSAFARENQWQDRFQLLSERGLM